MTQNEVHEAQSEAQSEAQDFVSCPTHNGLPHQKTKQNIIICIYYCVKYITYILQCLPFCLNLQITITRCLEDPRLHAILDYL